MGPGKCASGSGDRPAESWRCKKGSLEDFREAIRADQNNRVLHADACIGLGKARLQLGNPEDALAAFNEAIGADALAAEAFLGRGRVFVIQNRVVEAKKEFDRANEINRFVKWQ